MILSRRANGSTSSNSTDWQRRSKRLDQISSISVEGLSGAFVKCLYRRHGRRSAESADAPDPIDTSKILREREKSPGKGRSKAGRRTCADRYCLIPSPLWCPLKLDDERVTTNIVMASFPPRIYKMQLMYDKTPSYCYRVHSSPSCTFYSIIKDVIWTSESFLSLKKNLSFGKQSIRATHSPVGTGMFANSPRHSRLRDLFSVEMEKKQQQGRLY